MALKTIFLDMDGVLDDFDKHADELELWREDIHKIDWKKLNAIGSKFWAEIEPFENGLYLYHKLLELCQEHGISLKILSAGRGAKCRFGKIEWLTKYCPEIPIENVIIKNKGIEKAQEASPDSILIDDLEKNIIAFKEAGGQVFHYKNNPEECIDYCRSLLKNT